MQRELQKQMPVWVAVPVAKETKRLEGLSLGIDKNYSSINCLLVLEYKMHGMDRFTRF